jgi:hypothetical protein
MARDRINEWAGLPYFNPMKVLYEARRQGFRHKLGGRTSLPPEIPHSEGKTLTAVLDAAVFAHGIVLVP